MSVTISDSTNQGAHTGNFSVGGFVGSVKGNEQSTVMISSCTNNGAATGSQSFVGGFVGAIEKNQQMNLSVSHSFNNGMISGMNYIGGCFGGFDHNEEMNTIIIQFTNRAIVNGNNFVGGIVGTAQECSNMLMDITQSANTGIVEGSGYGVSGFLGRFWNNKHVNMTVNNSENNGSVSGNDYVGGFAGFVYSDTSTNALIVVVANSVNRGTISSNSRNTCGFFCVDTSLYHLNTTVVNSINRGTVTTTGSANGITNMITKANNVVSIGEVSNSSNSNFKSSSFWSSMKKEEYIGTLYGMEETCVNCPEKTTFFVRDPADGFYRTNDTGERVDEMLDQESSTNKYGAQWSFGLFVTTCPVSVKVGTPVNTVVTACGVRGLEELRDLCSVLMSECLVVDNSTKQELRESSAIRAGTTVIFCHEVRTSGEVQRSWHAEHGTPLANVGDFAPLCSNKYILSNASDQTQTLSCATRVTETLHVAVAKASTVEVVISPGGAATEEDVKDALTDLVKRVGDAPSHVDVVPDGDGSFIVSITISEDDTASLVEALETCI